MARGLSDLQKWMLIRALENSESELCQPKPHEAIPSFGLKEWTEYPVHLTRNEIRADYYRFTAYRWRFRRGYKRTRLGFEEHTAVFLKSKIPNYMAVSVAISKAHRRLIRRGFAIDSWRFYLTESGKELARSVTVTATLRTRVARVGQIKTERVSATPEQRVAQRQPITGYLGP